MNNKSMNGIDDTNDTDEIVGIDGIELTEDDLFPELPEEGLTNIDDILCYCAQLEHQLGLDQTQLSKVALENAQGCSVDIYLINICIQQQRLINEACHQIEDIYGILDNYNFL